MPRRRFFIKRAIKSPGSLSKQLGIPIKKNIPNTLLAKIVKSKPGNIIKNPTKLGKRRIKVTKKLGKRVNLAIILKKIAKKRRKK